MCKRAVVEWKLGLSCSELATNCSMLSICSGGLCKSSKERSATAAKIMILLYICGLYILGRVGGAGCALDLKDSARPADSIRA